MGPPFLVLGIIYFLIAAHQFNYGHGQHTKGYQKQHLSENEQPHSPTRTRSKRLAHFINDRDMELNKDFFSGDPVSRYSENSPTFLHMLMKSLIIPEMVGTSHKLETNHAFEFRNINPVVHKLVKIRHDEDIIPTWPSRGRRSGNDVFGNRTRREEDFDLFWGNRGKKNDDSNVFWGNRGKKSDDNDPFWGNRGKKDDNDPFWGNRGKKDIGDPFWGNRGKKSTEIDPLWGNRGKKNNDDNNFWGNMGKKNIDEDPFWGNRGKKNIDEDPFWGNRGKKNIDEDPFWGNRGKKPYKNPFWGNRGKKDIDDPFWGNRGKKNNDEDRFWGNRGKKDPDEDPFWGNRGKREIDDDPFWGNRGKKTVNDDPFWGNRGKKDIDIDPFWGNRGKRLRENYVFAKSLSPNNYNLKLLWRDQNKILNNNWHKLFKAMRYHKIRPIPSNHFYRNQGFVNSEGNNQLWRAMKTDENFRHIPIISKDLNDNLLSLLSDIIKQKYTDQLIGEENGMFNKTKEMPSGLYVKGKSGVQDDSIIVFKDNTSKDLLSHRLKRDIMPYFNRMLKPVKKGDSSKILTVDDQNSNSKLQPVAFNMKTTTVKKKRNLEEFFETNFKNDGSNTVVISRPLDGPENEEIIVVDSDRNE